MNNYDYSKLINRMNEKNITFDLLSIEVGVSKRTLNFKLKNKVDFKQDEITKICEILDIPNEEIWLYFFQQKNDKSKENKMSQMIKLNNVLYSSDLRALSNMQWENNEIIQRKIKEIINKINEMEENYGRK